MNVYFAVDEEGYKLRGSGDDFAHGSSVVAKRLAVYPQQDIAILKLPRISAGCRPFPLIDTFVDSGERVYLLGNSLRGENVFTTSECLVANVLSPQEMDQLVGRDSSEIADCTLIQMLGIVKPGDSGGPVVNVLGELVGMAQSVYSHDKDVGNAVHVSTIIEKLAHSKANPQTFDDPPRLQRRPSTAGAAVDGEADKGRVAIPVPVPSPVWLRR